MLHVFMGVIIRYNKKEDFFNIPGAGRIEEKHKMRKTSKLAALK